VSQPGVLGRVQRRGCWGWLEVRITWARAVVQVPRVQPKMRVRVELLEIQVRAARLVGRELGVAVWLSYRHRGAWPGRRGRR